MNPERVSIGEEGQGRSFHVDGPCHYYCVSK